MGKIIFVGYRHVKYTAKDGRDVEGYSLYFNEEREDVVGLSCFDHFVGVDCFFNCFDSVSPGDFVVLNYNRYGKLSGCTVIN